MRYIDTQRHNIPDNWLVLAKQELGKTHKSLWSYLKTYFEAIVGKKCWFSECINLGADNDIEHFRPKAKRIKELLNENAELEINIWQQLDVNSRDGYEFLKYEILNYRYACTFVNSLRRGQNNKVRGKSNFFPLKNNSPYATSIENLDEEVISLLDPCNAADPGFLTCNKIGEIEPSISVVNNSWEYCKVKVSIEVYHLHYYRFVEARIQVWNDCKTLIELANDLSADGLTQLEVKCFKSQIEQLKKRTDKESPFSSAAVDCIRQYKKSYYWLEKFFPDYSLMK